MSTFKFSIVMILLHTRRFGMTDPALSTAIAKF
jgi:hypothetical protein